MIAASAPGLADHSHLSPRESEILHLAAEGLIDEQIAQRLEIRPSTVNSYWVRIRSKLGSHSRTELVATLIRRKAESSEQELRRQIEELQKEVERLRAECQVLPQPLTTPRRHSDGSLAGGFEALALASAPEAVLIIEAPATICYANGAAGRVFRCEAEELVGRSCEEMVAPQQRQALLGQLRSFFACRQNGRVALGDKFPFFGSRNDGTLFQAITSVEELMVEERQFAVCVIVDFMAAIDVRRRAHASPFLLS